MVSCICMYSRKVMRKMQPLQRQSANSWMLFLERRPSTARAIWPKQSNNTSPIVTEIGLADSTFEAIGSISCR